MTVEEFDAVSHLTEYIEEDAYYNHELKITDQYGKDCYNHCKDISIILKALNTYDNMYRLKNYEQTMEIRKLKKELKEYKKGNKQK